MVSKLISLRLVLASLATLLLGAALACGSAEPVAAPEVDTAAIAAAVTKSITESAPKQVTSEEIQAMVQTAVQAGPVERECGVVGRRQPDLTVQTGTAR